VHNSEQNNAATLAEESYRNSHLAKGSQYQDEYDSNAYLRAMWQLEQDVLQKVIRDYFPAAVPQYLDFACGTGRICRFVKNFCTQTTAIDISEDMLRIAKDRDGDSNYVLGDLTADDPFPGQEFDLITTFRFFPNAEPALRAAVASRLVEHLSPDGILVFNNHLNHGSVRHKIFTDFRGKYLSKFFGRGMQHSMERSEVAALISGCGLEVVQVIPVAQLPFTKKINPRVAGIVLAFEKAFGAISSSEQRAHNNIYVCKKRR